MAGTNLIRNHHNLQRNLKLNGNYISNDGGDEGILITDAGLVGIGATTPTALLEVEQGSTGGVTAFSIDNDDTDEIAMAIYAANINADVLEIQANAVSVAKVIDISATGLTDGTILKTLSTSSVTDGGSSSLVYFSMFNDGVGDQTAKGTLLDYNKTGITASGKTANVSGLHIDMDDTATNVGTVNMTGLDIDLNFANTGGTVTNTGIDINVSSADTNYGINVLSTDRQLQLSYDGSSYADITVVDDSHTTITTGESGDLTLDPAGAIKLEGGSSIQMGNNFVFDSSNYAMMWGGTSQQVEITSGNLQLTTSGNLDCNATGEIDFNTSTAGFTAQTGTDGVDIDWTAGNKYHLLVENNSTVTFATNPTNPCNLLLKVTQGNGGSKIITWDVDSGDIYWAGGGKTDTDKPTLTTTDDDSDILSFYFDGTNYFGVASLNFDTAP